MANPYRVRAATLADADTLVAHRIGMFADMGVEMDAAAVGAAFHPDDVRRGLAADRHPQRDGLAQSRRFR